MRIDRRQRRPVILSHSRTNCAWVCSKACQSVGVSTLNLVMLTPPGGGGTSPRGEWVNCSSTLADCPGTPRNQSMNNCAAAGCGASFTIPQGCGAATAPSGGMTHSTGAPFDVIDR